MNRSDICIKAMVLFQRQDQILVYEVRELDGTIRGYRLPGGHVEFGEYSYDTAIREIKEEMNTDITDVKLFHVFENIFSYHDKPHHEIIFVYTAKFVDQTLYHRDTLTGTENNRSFNLVWCDPAENGVPIFPEGLVKVIG